METNVFGQPDNMQPENVQKEGNNPTLIVILLILILGGAAVLGFLLYRQSQEPAPVLDEVVETIELPTQVANPEVANDLPTVETGSGASTGVMDQNSQDTLMLDTPVE